MFCKLSVGVNPQEPKDDEFALGRAASVLPSLRSRNRRWERHKSPPIVNHALPSSVILIIPDCLLMRISSDIYKADK